MASGRNILFPRDAIPADVGAIVRARRIAHGWTQARLASKVGVSRRTIVGVEKGRQRPTSNLVHALEDVLEIVKLVPGWKDAAFAGSPSFGPRTREARRAAGLTIGVVARSAGVSSSTLSRFERELGDTRLIMDLGCEDGAMRNDALARVLGFVDAMAMDEYCKAPDGRPWLKAIATQRSLRAGNGQKTVERART